MINSEGALNFFTENLGTFVFTTVEDTVESYNEYETLRIEYDAEKYDLAETKKTMNPNSAVLALGIVRHTTALHCVHTTVHHCAPLPATQHRAKSCHTHATGFGAW